MTTVTVLRAALALQLLASAAGVLLGVSLGGRVPPAVLDGEALDERATRMPPPRVAPLPRALSSGLVFVHMPKTGGSTFGGVLRRIAYRRGLAHARDHEWLGKEALGSPRTPALYADHGIRSNISGELDKRMPGAFYVTLLRNPADRCLSGYYHFVVTRGGKEPTEDSKLYYMREQCPFDAEATTIRPPRASETSEDAVLAGYDFVAVTERFDESLVVLGKKLGVSQLDLLYLKSKDSGSGVDPLTRKPMQSHPPLHQEPKSVQELAQQLMAGADARLLAHANVNLDGEIAAYGPSFEADLAQFRRRNAVVAARCQAEFWEACLYDDSGCGQDCIEAVAQEQHWD